MEFSMAPPSHSEKRRIHRAINTLTSKPAIPKPTHLPPELLIQVAENIVNDLYHDLHIPDPSKRCTVANTGPSEIDDPNVVKTNLYLPDAAEITDSAKPEQGPADPPKAIPQPSNAPDSSVADELIGAIKVVSQEHRAVARHIEIMLLRSAKIVSVRLAEILRIREAEEATNLKCTRQVRHILGFQLKLWRLQQFIRAVGEVLKGLEQWKKERSILASGKRTGV